MNPLRCLYEIIIGPLLACWPAKGTCDWCGDRWPLDDLEGVSDDDQICRPCLADQKCAGCGHHRNGMGDDLFWDVVIADWIHETDECWRLYHEQRLDDIREAEAQERDYLREYPP